MGVADGGFELFVVFEELAAFVDGAAEDGVDESADGGAAAVDGFVDGGVVGDAEDEDLGEADTKDVAGFVVEFAFSDLGDVVVEEAAIAEDGEDEGVEEAAVGGGELVFFGVFVDEGFGVDVTF